MEYQAATLEYGMPNRFLMQRQESRMEYVADPIEAFMEHQEAVMKYQEPSRIAKKLYGIPRRV